MVKYLNIFFSKFCGYLCCKDHAFKKRKDPFIDKNDLKFHRICLKCDKKYLQYTLNIKIL
jgi:hypothetical protein